MRDATASCKNKPIYFDSRYAEEHANNMMLDAYGSGRVYHFVPEKHEAYLKSVSEN